MAKHQHVTSGGVAEQRRRVQVNRAVSDDSGSRPYSLQGINWTTQVGTEGGPNSEADMSIAGESSPARSRAATGSKRS